VILNPSEKSTKLKHKSTPQIMVVSSLRHPPKLVRTFKKFSLKLLKSFRRLQLLHLVIPFKFLDKMKSAVVVGSAVNK